MESVVNLGVNKQKSSTELYKIAIKIAGGNGGNGCVSFRRERKIPKGGPDGGDGGDGGNIYIMGASLQNLYDFRYHRVWKAGNGQDGSSQNRTGRRGDDNLIRVPIGTQVFDENLRLIVDITEDQTRYLLVKGGVGGHGNKRFATPSLQDPGIATKGQKVETQMIWLILKYMSDIGTVGLPNAGKSTFVNLISNAPVKIGDYHFSTLEPVLGTIDGMVVADLPGLIEGAHLGLGLGHQFLQHVERCIGILHFVAADDPDYRNSFNIIRNELKQYNPELLDKQYYICVSKIDLASGEQLKEIYQYFINSGYKVNTMYNTKPEAMKILDWIRTDLIKSPVVFD
jgi:GTP-binding protein